MRKRCIPTPKVISFLVGLFDDYKVLYIPYPFYCIDPIVNIGGCYKNTKRIVCIPKYDDQAILTEKSLFQDLIIEIMAESLRESLGRQLLMELSRRNILKSIKPIGYRDFESVGKFIHKGVKI